MVEKQGLAGLTGAKPAVRGAVQVPLLLMGLGAAAAISFGFAAFAPNRLISGRPIPLAEAAGLAGPAPAALLAVGVLLIAAAILHPETWSRWASIAGAGLAVAALGWMAARAATALSVDAPPAARTSLGAGFWMMTVCGLLIAGDAIQRLRAPPLLATLAVALALGPLAALLAAGQLAPLSLLKEYAIRREAFHDALLRHIWLVAGALLPTVALGLPLGVAAWRRHTVRRAVFPVLNVVQTIPSIALFGLLIAPLSGLADQVPLLRRLGISGIGTAPAIIALVLYSLLPVVRNTMAGLEGVPPPVRDAARGMGMTPRQAFWQVDAALALPVIVAGLRITAVQAVGLAAVSALIGAGGLGAIMFQGLFANALDQVLLGALPIILLAVAVDLLFRLIEQVSARGSRAAA